MGKVDPSGENGERQCVTGFWRPAPCDPLDDAAAADFVGDGVEARVPLRMTLVGFGDPASLLRVDEIGRVKDGGMALMLKSDLGAVVDRGTPRSALK